ncbi:hypothetical protein DPMN_081524 [Dreissena polymorpha]|uniref:Uncharacterized protein n=1 Tax=Dreissena polymorpha TaxID=45954 RepID=A0A9D3Y636_DREPO|nr:hypothetical protein DPMN_081524 [Dreissena polymorpha]
MKVSFFTKNKRINVDTIQLYAATNDRKEDEKDSNRLSTIIQARSKKNIIIPMSDFITKIGTDNL